MENISISKDKFVEIVDDVFNNYEPQQWLSGVWESLVIVLDLDLQEYCLDDKNNENMFEGFIKEKIDKYGAAFTGNEALEIVEAKFRGQPSA